MAIPYNMFGVKIQPAAGAVAPKPLGPIRPGGPSITTLAVLGALGVGGYFLYRHFQKG